MSSCIVGGFSRRAHFHERRINCLKKYKPFAKLDAVFEGVFLE
jgi:hypothetical protein